MGVKWDVDLFYGFCVYIVELGEVVGMYMGMLVIFLCVLCIYLYYVYLVYMEVYGYQYLLLLIKFGKDFFKVMKEFGVEYKKVRIDKGFCYNMDLFDIVNDWFFVLVLFYYL